MARLGISALAILVLGLAASCGTDSGDEDAATGAESGAAATTPPITTTPRTMSTIPPPTMTRSASPPTYPSDQVKPITVSGRVSRSGECIDLVTSTTRWTLLGDAAAHLEDGTEVEVSGLPMPQMETRCGDAPLDVREVRPR